MNPWENLINLFKEFTSFEFRQNGFELITDGSHLSKTFRVLEMNGNTTFSANDLITKNTLSSKTLTDGKILYGKFNNVNVSAGEIIGYY